MGAMKDIRQIRSAVQKALFDAGYGSYAALQTVASEGR